MKTLNAFCVLIVFSVSLIGCSFGAKEAIKPLLTVGYLGSAEGDYAQTAWTKRKYLKFIDLPYASTSKENRFKPPLLVVPFDETYNADTNDAACPSFKNLDDIQIFGELLDYEDCLHLTISTPNRTADNLPVMVYLAGYDLLDSENEDAEGEYLLEKDVVLVTVQYRGGPFGFLSTLTEDMPGNVGVLDVIEALRYVNKHIKHFGGDNKRVTLFGQYGNAAIIHILTMTPLIEKENLFQQVIYQSGSALMTGLTTRDPVDYTKKMAKLMGCNDVDDLKVLHEFFQTADITALLYGYRDAQKEYGDMPFFVVGGPSGLLSDEPRILLERGAYRSYPTIGGVVTHAAMGTGQLDNAEHKYDNHVSNFEKSLMQFISNPQYEYIVQENLPSKVFAKVMFNAIWPGVVDIHSLDVKEATLKALLYNCENDRSYLYAFNYLGKSNRLQKSEDDNLDDVSLTDDNIYLFPFRQYSKTLTKDDKTMSRIMVDLWTSFATDGVPKSSLIIGHWPQMVKDQNGPYMKLNLVPEVGYYYPDEFFTTVLDTRQGFILD